MNDILAIMAQCRQDSLDWFGEDVANDVGHMTLALAGEVGEFCNVMKKVSRGSLDPKDPEVKLDLALELTDVFIYVCNLAVQLNVNLGEAYDYKRGINAERFADHGHKPSGLSVVGGGVPEGSDSEAPESGS